MPRKGENIYKRKDNRWEGRYIRYYDPDGSPKYGYCYAKTYREVKQKLTLSKNASLNGLPVSRLPQNARLSDYCDEWLRINRTKIKESTYAKYNNMLEKHIKPRLGDCLVRRLSTFSFEQFSHDLLFEEELSPKTVKDILTLLHSVIQYLGRRSAEPLQPIEIIYPKIPKSDIRVLTPDEQKRFIEYLSLDSDECKFGVLLALLSGMRIGEVCALKWKDVSLRDRCITVRSTMQRLHDFDSDASSKTKIVISQPKTSFSVRTIPMTDYAARICSLYWVDDPEAFVLTGQRQRYIEPRTLQYRMERYTADCALTGVHFHTLRHTFATRCVEVDFEIKSLSEILGHSSPKITLERYVHSSMQLKRDNMNKLASVGL